MLDCSHKVMMAARLWLWRKGLDLGQDFIHVLNTHTHSDTQTLMINWDAHQPKDLNQPDRPFKHTDKEMNQGHTNAWRSISRGWDRSEWVSSGREKLRHICSKCTLWVDAMKLFKNMSRLYSLQNQKKTNMINNIRNKCITLYFEVNLYVHQGVVWYLLLYNHEL